MHTLPHLCLNPRFVGQVFRQPIPQTNYRCDVLIPDLWGKSSDDCDPVVARYLQVLIPDLWGKSSDM